MIVSGQIAGCIYNYNVGKSSYKLGKMVAFGQTWNLVIGSPDCSKFGVISVWEVTTCCRSDTQIIQNCTPQRLAALVTEILYSENQQQQQHTFSYHFLILYVIPVIHLLTAVRI